ncbi:MAG: hypothetical protein CVT49_14305 [candidate division Zixibacteria bacterium HGW-Zixibacteria-1]|nr:MAG: hypothetical protein CVT49_14305 [candidate division Zixibacteria bacterium HGW-Zixibacteria-1]
MTGGEAASYLDNSAAQYLTKNGWVKIRVLGAIPAAGGVDEKHILISHQYDLYILDPMIIPYLPDPGMYWAKSSGSSWTLLYPDGETHDFWGKGIK